MYDNLKFINEEVIPYIINKDNHESSRILSLFVKVLEETNCKYINEENNTILLSTLDNPKKLTWILHLTNRKTVKLYDYPSTIAIY
jgi:hypothetical protein